MRTTVSVAVVGLLCAGLASGQSTFGRIVGTVLDPSGHRVAGATVAATELDTGALANGSTDETGFFQFLNLKAGRYALVAEKPGFASGNAGPLTLNARQSVRSELALTLPGVREAITVQADLGGIDTEDGTIAETRTFSQITQLPLNFRASGTNPLSAIHTVPGVRGTGGNDTTLAGGFPAQVEYSIDGISSVNIRFPGPLTDNFPSPEMASELTVTSVDAGAEFGQMGDVSLITRSGTNEYHGSLLWYHQNAAMDAKAYGSPVKQAKIFNTFGGSVGGPLNLPGFYRGKDRTFFLFDYEGNRKPGNLLRQASVPTTQMWGGDLTGVPGPATLDPLTGQPFPLNTIPKTRISPVATALSKFYPAPNFDSGSTLNNYRELMPNTISVDGFDVRVDHVFSSRQQVFARYSSRGIEIPSGHFRLGPLSQGQQSNRSVVFAHNFALSSGLLNEFRAGATRWTNREHFPLRGVDAVAALGLQGLDLSGVGTGGGIPAFSFSDGTGFTGIFHGREADSLSRSIQITDNLTWMRGGHTFKFGVDIRALGYKDTLHIGENDEFGYFQFNQGAFSQNAFSDLLLGLPSSTQVGVVGPNLRQRTTHWHFYVQDQWRVSSRLTLTLGLRWQVHPPMTEDAGNITNFDRTNGNVIIPDQTLAPAPGFLTAINACPGTSADYPCTKVVTASETGLGPGLRKTQYGNWTPRFGFAFRPFRSNRTVIRGGFGSYTQTMLGFFAFGLTGIHTSDSRTYQNFQGPGLPPLFTFPQTSGGPFALGQPGGARFGVGTDPDYRDPRSYQWNFTIEQALRANLAMRVSYVGTNSVGLTQQVDLNQVPVSSVPYSAGRKPYQVWNSVLSLDNIGFVNYQALETELTQRFSHGTNFQASYTLGKHLGNAAGPTGGFGTQPIYPSEYIPRVPTDRFNLGLDRGNLGSLRRHRFVLTGVFPVPVGRNRLIGGGLSRFAEALVGGWDLTTVLLAQSGQFQTPTISAAFDRSNTNVLGRFFATARPDRIGDGNLQNPTPGRFYDIGAFVAAPVGAGRPGNSGVGILRGPHQLALSAGLAKTFQLRERVRLRMEGTFTNLPNHPNFQAPAVVVSTPANFGKLTSVLGAENGGNRGGQLGVRLDF